MSLLKYLKEDMGEGKGDELVTKWIIVNAETGEVSSLLVDKLFKAHATVSSYNATDYDSPAGGEGGWGAYPVKVRRNVMSLKYD